MHWTKRERVRSVFVQPRPITQRAGSGDDVSLQKKYSKIEDRTEREANKGERSSNSSLSVMHQTKAEQVLQTGYTEQEQTRPSIDENHTNNQIGEGDEDNVLIKESSSAAASDEDDTDPEKEDNGTKTRKCKFLEKLKNPITEKFFEALEKGKNKFDIDVTEAMKNYSEGCENGSHAEKNTPSIDCNGIDARTDQCIGTNDRLLRESNNAVFDSTSPVGHETRQQQNSNGMGFRGLKTIRESCKEIEPFAVLDTLPNFQEKFKQS